VFSKQNLRRNVERLLLGNTRNDSNLWRTLYVNATDTSPEGPVGSMVRNKEIDTMYNIKSTDCIRSFSNSQKGAVSNKKYVQENGFLEYTSLDGNI